VKTGNGVDVAVFETASVAKLDQPGNSIHFADQSLRLRSPVSNHETGLHAEAPAVVQLRTCQYTRVADGSAGPAYDTQAFLDEATMPESQSSGLPAVT
jgi:hypothetical protein